MSERWLPIPGYDNYQVSDLGRVRGCKKVLKPQRHSRTRYWHVSLYRNGSVQTRLIHQLVLEAFVGPRPAGCECLHADDNAANNQLSNLRYGSRSANRYDSVRNGRDHNARKTHCPQGHPYIAENVYAYDGRRQCKPCTVSRARERRTA